MNMYDIIEHEHFELFILGCCLGLIGVLYFKMREILNDYQKVNRENMAHILASYTFISANKITAEEYNDMFSMYYDALEASEEEEE